MTQAASFCAALQAGNHSAAIKLLDSAINAGPTEPLLKCSLHINRGVCNSRLQLYRKALKDFDAALECNPASVEAMYHKGVVLVALKKPQEAERVWHSALASVGLSTDLHLIAALQGAVRNPTGVLHHLGTHGHLWAAVSKPWVLFAFTVLVAFVAQLLARHSFQVAPSVAATASSLYSSASSSTQTSQHTPAPPPASQPVSQPATPPNGSGRPATPVAAGSSPSTAAAAPPASTASSQSAHTHAPAASTSNTASKHKAAKQSDTIASEEIEELDCVAAQQTARAASAAAAGPRVVIAHDAAAAGAASHGGKGSKAGPSSSHSHTHTPNGHTRQPHAPHTSHTAQENGHGGHAQQHHHGSRHTNHAPSTGQGGSRAGPVTLTAQEVAKSVQLAVSQINAGQVSEAEALLDSVLTVNSRELGARVARGTARALKRDLKGAIEDFSVAIEIEPRYADTWKRRGQARSALGENEDALVDLQKAIDLLPLWGDDTSVSRAECYVEKGLIHQKARDYRRATQELKEAVKLDPANPQAWNLLGLSSTSQGELKDGIAAYERAVQIKPDLKEAWFNMAQACKEAGRVKDAEKAFAKVFALEPPGKVNVAAYKIMAQMKQQCGEHWAAVTLIDKALPATKDEQAVELLYLRAICYHALGLVREAARDYDSCLTWSRAPGTSGHGKPLPEETRTFQFLAFYQREMALYLYQCLDRRVDSFCMDAELPAVFKENWCKKGAPTPDLISSYKPQPLPPAVPRSPPPRTDAAVLQPLVRVADQLGHMLQNQHQGFMANVRQQRAAGFAALELAQAVRALVTARRAGSPVWVQSQGSSVHRGAEGRHEFGWRDAMDIVVKWRQLAEPNDQVVWVDLLTRREFEQGFGSHTPIFSGQTKCVRYYMNFDRALGLQKQVLLKEGHAFDAQNRHVPCGGAHQQDNIRAARTCEDMYAVLKSDTWVVIPIASVARPDHSLEGTRLTLVKVPNQPDAYEFSIRTPVTPPRWSDFDRELEEAWEAVVGALSQEHVDLPHVARLILTYAYYWYNFMPLARGTAACGYTTLLSLFWAAGMPVTARIPRDYQVDWEAILSQHPDKFISAVSSWLLPAAARANHSVAAESAKAQSATLPSVSDLPPVSDVLGTVRERIDALNSDEVPRVQ